MPMNRHYQCLKCGEEFEILWRDSKEAQNTATCECGHKAKRLYGSQLHIDDWTPETNDGRRDIEHFEKKRIKDGKYVSKQTMYKEDRMKQGISMNLGEV